MPAYRNAPPRASACAGRATHAQWYSRTMPAVGSTMGLLESDHCWRVGSNESSQWSSSAEPSVAITHSYARRRPFSETAVHSKSVHGLAKRLPKTTSPVSMSQMYSSASSPAAQRKRCRARERDRRGEERRDAPHARVSQREHARRVCG